MAISMASEPPGQKRERQSPAGVISANFFASRNIEIVDLTTRHYNAAHTGAAMFSVRMAVNIPAETHLATLREEFHEYSEEQNLDSIMEPMQR